MNKLSPSFTEISFLQIIMVALFLFIGMLSVNSQFAASQDTKLSLIRAEGLQHSKAYSMLSELTDVYGQRLTGSREYLKAAQWAKNKLIEIGLGNAKFENFCNDCRGWSIKSFNVEMVSPNYMNIIAYPLAMSKSTKGILEGEVVQIESPWDMQLVQEKFANKLKGKVVLLGKVPKMAKLSDTLFKRFGDRELEQLADQLLPKESQTPLPELIKSWETSDRYDQKFLQFVEKEGAIAVLRTSGGFPGILHSGGTYYYLSEEFKPLPYFAVAPEHFGRLVRTSNFGIKPKVRIHLETEFYKEPENSVNIIGELIGSDENLKKEIILIGGHFDSWHAATGATDNAASTVVLLEALRILRDTDLIPKRTIKIGLWGGEEQAFLGSVSYAKDHLGPMDQKPNKTSNKISTYLNLDNGAGAIRGIYLQDNEFARPIFRDIFKAISTITSGTLTIENTLSTDHETFDHYNIPSFQFIQDPLSYETVTHHTNMDFIEYVPTEDLMRNAVILAWTIYSLGELNEKVPRKSKE